MTKDKKTQKDQKQEAPKKGFKFFGFCLRSLSIFAIIIFIILGAGIWRLSSAPVEISFLKDTINERLVKSNTNLKLSFSGLFFDWQDFSRAPRIYASNVKLGLDDALSVLEVPKITAELSTDNILKGGAGLTEIIIEQANVRILKTSQGFVTFKLTNAPYEEKPELVETLDEQSLKTVSKGFWQSVNDTQSFIQKAGFNSLEKIYFEDADIDVIDLSRRSKANYENIDVLITKKTDQLDVLAKGAILKDKESQNEISLHAAINTKTRSISSKLNLPKDGLRFKTIDKIANLGLTDIATAALKGTISIEVAETLLPEIIKLDVEASDIAFQKDNLEVNADLDHIKLKAQYFRDRTQTSTAAVNIHFKQMENPINAAYELRDQDDAGALMSLVMDISELKHSELDALWPENIDHVAKRWLVTNMKDGSFKDVRATIQMNGTPKPNQSYSQTFLDSFKAAFFLDQDWDVNYDSMNAEFAFENLEMFYVDTLFPAKNTNGKGVIKGKALTLTVDKGEIGELKVAPGGTLFFNDLVTKGAGKAKITLNLSGSLKAVFDYISPEPINFQEKFDADAENSKGQASLDLLITFPTTKDMKVEEVGVNVDATLTDVHVPEVFQGFTLAGGPYNLKANTSYFNLSGSGKLASYPVDLTWERYFESAQDAPFESKAVIALETDSELTKRFGVELEEYVQGPFKLNIDMEQRKDGIVRIKPNLDLQAANVKFNALGYEKPEGIPLTVDSEIILKNETLSEIVYLTAKSDDLRVENTRLVFDGQGAFSRGEVGTLRVGENNLTIRAESGAAGRIRASMTGAFLDVRPFLENDDINSTDMPPLEISADLEAVRTDDGRIIQRVKTYFKTSKSGRIEEMAFDGIAGTGDLNVRYTPDAKGDLHFKLLAKDAGATLAAFGIFDNIKGGALKVEGKPVRDGVRGDLEGRAIMQDFAIVDAPALAKLLNALSLSGFMSTLQNKGIEFSKLGADFDFKDSANGKILTLREGRTSGSALGVGFEGYINQDKQEIDLKGTIVPVSGVNKLVSKIPVIGEAITGGEDSALFAATYTVKGTLEDPKVSVNPLSALAPGILRKLFFEGEAPKADTAPSPKQVPAN